MPDSSPRPGAGTTLGIDPGLDGGLVWLGPAGERACITPTLIDSKTKKRRFDGVTMRALLLEQPVGLVVIERVGTGNAGGRSAKQSTTAWFNFGTGYGLWLGLLIGLEIPYVLVTPQRWKGVILQDTDKSKLAAIAFMQARYPGVPLLANARCKKPHDGIADAGCLSAYGQITLHRDVAAPSTRRRQAVPVAAPVPPPAAAAALPAAIRPAKSPRRAPRTAVPVAAPVVDPAPVVAAADPVPAGPAVVAALHPKKRR